MGKSRISRDGLVIGEVSFPPAAEILRAQHGGRHPLFQDRRCCTGATCWRPRFSQTCIRYQSRTKTCQFCAIGQSLAAGRTIERKTPAQLAEVAKAAVRARRREAYGDDHRHAARQGSRRGDPHRGAAAVKAAVDLPIQVQCEPPDDDAWFARMHEAGADALGMHLEACTEEVRSAHHARQGAGLGGALLRGLRGALCRCSGGARSRPISSPGSATARGYPRRLRPADPASASIPSSCPSCRSPARRWKATPPRALARLHASSILGPLSGMMMARGLKSIEVKAGCAKCGACSALSTYERRACS